MKKGTRQGNVQSCLGMGAGTGQDMARIITARRRAEAVVEAIFSWTLADGWLSRKR